MPDEPTPPATRASAVARVATAWRRLTERLPALAGALDAGYDEIQDRRIRALERDVAQLRALVSGMAHRSDAPPGTADRDRAGSG